MSKYDNKFYCIPVFYPPFLWSAKVFLTEILLPMLALVIVVLLLLFILQKFFPNKKTFASHIIWNILFFIIAFLIFIYLFPVSDSAHAWIGSNYLLSYASLFFIVLFGQIILKAKGFRTSRFINLVLVIFVALSLFVAIDASHDLLTNYFGNNHASGESFPAYKIPFSHNETLTTGGLTNGCGNYNTGFRLW